MSSTTLSFKNIDEIYKNNGFAQLEANIYAFLDEKQVF